MFQVLILCVLGMSQAVPFPVSNFLGYNLPYFYNFNQPNPSSAASFHNPNNFGYSFAPTQASGFQQINPFGAQFPHLNNAPVSFPQVASSGSVIPSGFSPHRQQHLLQTPFTNSFASQPHAALQSLHPYSAPFPQLGQSLHNPLATFHRHPNPSHYAAPSRLNSHDPRVEVQRINLPPIVRENKLEIRQPILNTVRYVQPTLYKVNRDRVDIDDDKYDFDDEDYKRGYSLQSQPTVLTYSIRSPSRDYAPEHSPLSYAIRTHPTLFKRSQPANYHDDHENENEERGEAKFKSAGEHEEASEEEAAEEDK